MSIEKIRLKNGDEYPISPAYREPVVEGKQMDYPFEIDPSDESAQILTVEENGEPSIVGVLLTQTVLSQAELRKCSGSFAMTVSGEPMGEYRLHCAGATDCNTFAAMLNTMIQVPFEEPITEFPGNVAILTAPGSGTPRFLVSVPEQGIYAHTETIEGETVTLEITVPAAGTYLLSAGELVQGAVIQGTLTVADYHLDERYAPENHNLVVPLMAGMQLLMTGSFPFGPGFENLAARAEHAAKNGEQLNLVMEGNMPGVIFSAQTTALYLTPGEAEWALSITVQGATYTGFRYDFATKVCTLITAE